jgi:response regulator of citrate/malate metabolism
MYTTVIIEDDPMITRLNRRCIEQDSRFAVVQTFSAAHPALFWLQRNPIDLIILDVYMPQMSGTELLLQLRAEGVDADVIMVTSANDAKTVNDAARLGAVDYLVKPFAYERFRQALDVFAGERACSATASVRRRSIIRCFRLRCRHSLSRRQKVCRARRFRALRHICGLRRIHGIPVMRSHRMLACQLSLCAGI